MKYRKFGNLSWRPSALGFGAMRFPVLENNPSRINEELAVKMLRHSVDKGVNYIDTAYPYHGGNSEIVVGKALRDGYRKKVRIATKMPSWLVEKPADLDRIFEEQLHRLDVEAVDFYLFHNLNTMFWPKMKKAGAYAWAEKKKAEGLIKHLGFSFHDDFSLFKEIIDDYNGWEFCQIQYNFVDVDFQAGKKGLDYAVSKGLGVVVMEPLKGGQLAAPAPDQLAPLWSRMSEDHKPVHWALQWLWNQKDVSLVLSGMSSFEQVEENLSCADQSGIGTMDPGDIEILRQIRRGYTDLRPVQCTSCKYCLPCPHGVLIPQIIELYNNARIYGYSDVSKGSYRFIPDDRKADNCVECGECEEKCPQDLPIIEVLKKAHTFLSQP